MAKFTQLSIDEQIEQLIIEQEAAEPQQFVYLDDISLDEHSYIACKLDWYTLMIEDHSINEVLAWIGLEDKCQDEFYKHQIERCSGFDEVFLFVYNGVSIEVRKSLIYDQLKDKSLFDKKLPKIRLDISGSGLDYLRSEHIDVDDILRDSTYLLDNSHITRCDFAFDFINYKPEIIDQLIHYCNNYHTAADRILICGLTAGLKYSIKTGGQKSVYFGSTGSDQLLRCYDKRLQYIDIESQVYIKDNPYHNPDSWVRIELQTRNLRAHKLCLGGSEFGGLLKYIINYYKFADTTTPAHRRELWQVWQNFVDYEALPPIIQNLQIVQKVRPVSERVDRSLDYWWRNFCALGSKDTTDSIFTLFIKVNIRLIQLQQNLHDPICNKRWKAFLNFMNQCNIKYDAPFVKDGLYRSDSGYLLFGISQSTAYDLSNNLERALQFYINGGTKNDI